MAMMSVRVQESIVTDVQCSFDKREMSRFIGFLCESLSPGGWEASDGEQKAYFFEDLQECLAVAMAEDDVKKYWELDTALREHFTDAYMMMHMSN